MDGSSGEVDFNDIISKDRASLGSSADDCGYSTQSSHSCSRVGGGDKVSCETLLEVIRNCQSKRSVKIFSKTVKQEDDNDDSLSHSSSSSSTFSWSSSSSNSSSHSGIGSSLDHLFDLFGGSGRSVPGIFGGLFGSGGDMDDALNHDRVHDERMIDPFSFFSQQLNEQFKALEEGFSNSYENNSNNPRFKSKIERYQISPPPPTPEFHMKVPRSNKRGEGGGDPSFVPPHKATTQKNSGTSSGPVEEI